MSTLSVLEEGLAANANDSVLSPAYNPGLLARARALSSDISFLLGTPNNDNSWEAHSIHQALISSPPPAFHAYVSRLTHLIEEEPRRLLAHSYVRYMGDLSGGQMMKRNIRKAYGLADKQGTTFYEFGVMGSKGTSNQSTANMGEIKRIKEWFRSSIDTGVGNDVKMKGQVYRPINHCLEHERLINYVQTEALLDEAMRAFALHRDIFDEIKTPSSTTPNPDAWTPSPTPLDQKPESSKTFSVSSVLTFMLAVGFAHFIIVVGGLSGSRGYAKLEAMHTWITNVFFS